MKTIFLALILTFAFGSFQFAEAQANEQVKVRVNQQKTASSSKLKIKFVSLVEDSRCPEGTQCVWAGNAKIKVQITTRRGETKMVELNTNKGAKGESIGGYSVMLESVTPAPKENIRIDRNGYTATFSVTKLKR
ncbi:MAG TPA: hypothetical protein VGC76_18955 [Pyrinomonadaceae bacterium]|jgi:hypothetical protein